VSAKDLDCPHCRRKVLFSLVHYINETAWPDFADTLFAQEFGEVTCNGCGNTYELSPPLVLDLPSRDLVVFATPVGDDEGVDKGFHDYLKLILPHLPPALAESAAGRPYTFVEGLPGLRALLSVFAGRPYSQPPVQRPADPEPFRSSGLDGFQYGKVFFYYPDQVPARDLVRLADEVAAELDEAGQTRQALDLVLGVVERIGGSHPWLTLQAGRLALNVGLADQAQDFLARAERQRHRWLAVTASYFDATPTRREGEDHGPPVRRAEPASVLPRGPVLGLMKHTVTFKQPALEDHGLWHFPRMASVSCPAEYTPLRIASAFALTFGAVARAEGEGMRFSAETSIYWDSALQNGRELLAEPEAPPWALAGFLARRGDPVADDPASLWQNVDPERLANQAAQMRAAGLTAIAAALEARVATARAGGPPISMHEVARLVADESIYRTGPATLVHIQTPDRLRGLAEFLDAGGFWDDYVLGRWALDIRRVDGNGVNELWATVTQAVEVVRAIEQEKAELPESRYILHRAVQHVRTRCCDSLAGFVDSRSESLRSALSQSPDHANRHAPVGGQPRPGDPALGPTEEAVQHRLFAIRQLLEAGKLGEGEELARQDSWRTPELQNAEAVCLLRRGEHSKAIELLGKLVYPQGSFSIPPTVPVKWRVNFAVAWVLAGDVSLCEELLRGIDDSSNETVKRVRAAIARWRASRTWFQRLRGSSEPVRLDFPPGEV
jgi:hypothetical protein